MGKLFFQTFTKVVPPSSTFVPDSRFLTTVPNGISDAALIHRRLMATTVLMAATTVLMILAKEEAREKAKARAWARAWA